MLIMSFSLYAQVKTFPFKGKILTTDQFGFYYAVKSTEINKYSSNGKLNCSYSNNILGEIASVDVSNPQKIIVYFKDFTQILILDNTLSPTSEVFDVVSLDLYDISLVSRSYNDGIWFYDPVRFELIRKDQELETTNSSGNLANVLNTNIEANYLVEYNNRLYLNDPKNGVLVFDNFGTYLKTIPLYGLLRFQVKNKFLIYVNSQGNIELYDFFTLEKNSYKPAKYSGIKSVRLEGNLLFIQDQKNQILIDKIEQ